MNWIRCRILVGGLVLGLVSGCAGVPPAQVAQTTATIVGAAILPGIGAPIGSLVGLLAGLLVQNEMDKATEKRERKTLHEELAAPASRTTTAPPEGVPVRVWVDETLHEGRLIAGHFDSRSLP